MSSKTSSGAKKRDPWEAFVFTLLFGLLILIAGGLNVYTITLGSGISFLAFMELPSVRLSLELKINKITGSNVFQVNDSQITRSNVIGSARDVYIGQPPQNPSTQPNKETKWEGIWEVDRTILLGPKEFEALPFEASEGQRLEGEVSSDTKLDVFILGDSSLSSFESNDDFVPFWEAEGVTRTGISYPCRVSRRVSLVIDNKYSQRGAGDAAVAVKLRLTSF